MTGPAATGRFTPRRVATAVKVGVAVAILFLAVPDAWYVQHLTLDQVVLVTTASVWALAGMVASIKRSDSRIGPLMILYAFVAYARDLPHRGTRVRAEIPCG